MATRICVLGAGSWGTTLAILLSKKGHPVALWEVSRKLATVLSRTRKNVQFLPSIRIPSRVRITPNIDVAIRDAKIIVVAVPSHAVREVVRKLANLKGSPIIVSAAKGIENKGLLRMSEVIREEIPQSQVVVLSGPSHAEEVSRGIPTTVVASSPDNIISRYVQSAFMTETFRVYTNPDTIGVELGGALKNIVAIAAGICDGLGFGSNTKAALLTRGMAEITRLGVAMGANPLTFSGLSGMGDLITTCISKYSRNRAVGEAIAKGKNLQEALEMIGQVAEGVRTTKAARRLARRYKVEVPITDEVYAILFRRKSPRRAVKNLMLRGAKDEMEEAG